MSEKLGVASGPSPSVLVVMGVSGAGKSTLGAALASELGWEFQEGDALHPRQNIDKMSAGIPLTDLDRAPWLAKVVTWIDEHIDRGDPGVITCSALARRYRDTMRRNSVTFVHVTGDPKVIARRLQNRQDHFMDPALLLSQLSALEVLGPDEQAHVVDVELALESQVHEVLAALRLSASCHT